MSKEILSFTINGVAQEVAIAPDAKLYDVIHEVLGLTGTKHGCGEGECGACTVLLNGRPVSSCITLAMDAQGAKVTTIEGLAGDDGTLHPIQEAFARGEAVQCGFCTPGMILAAKALLDRNRDPSEQEIRRALAGNLCRCTGYTGIVAAVQEAAAVLRGEAGYEPIEEKHADVVGEPIERIGAREKVQGKAVYVADMKPAGMLHAAIVRSPHARAEIKEIDTTRAAKQRGVHAVLTAKDLPDVRWGLLINDEPILARDKVRYVGERVALVAAETPQIARKAASMVKVDYKVLPPVLDMEEARKAGAIQVHDNPGRYDIGYFGVPLEKVTNNLTTSMVIDDGDLDAGFEDADVVLEEEYKTMPQHQGHIEPHIAMAQPEPGGRVTVHTSTQVPFIARHSVATYLDIPMSKVRVVWCETGGGFGNKVPCFVEPMAAALAMKTGRPVRLAYSRQEELVDSRPRANTITRIKTGAKRDGTLVARQLEFLVDNGAYCDCGPLTAGGTVEAARGPYRIPNVHLEGHSIYTNKFNTGPFRAPGYPQITFAMESHMDSLASALGMDPVDLRRKNALRTGDTTFAGSTIQHDAFYRCLEAVAQKAAADPAGENEGWGLGCGEWRTGGHPCGAVFKVNEDGTVALTIGSSDLTGSKTSIGQVAAQELGLPWDKLSVVIGDTDSAPLAAPSGGSMVTFNMTNVVRKGARELADKLKGLASEELDRPAEDLEVADGRVFVRDDPNTGVSFAELGAAEPIGLTTSFGVLPPTDAFCVNGVKVRVDPSTGEVTVLRVISAIDCGKAINPASVRGQASGGFVQAMGMALFEEIVQDPTDGHVVTQGFTDYRMPTAVDVPSVEVILVEGDPSDSEGHGCKGVGEPVHVPGVAAVANAIAAATGVRLYATPMTPERILRARGVVYG